MIAFGNDPGRWASTASMAHALGMVVSYSLRQLSEWLSSGGMSRGMPPRHAYMVKWSPSLSATVHTYGMHACMHPWHLLSGAAHLCTCAVPALPAISERCNASVTIWLCSYCGNCAGWMGRHGGAVMAKSPSAVVMHECADDSVHLDTAFSVGLARAGWKLPERASVGAPRHIQCPPRQQHAAGAGRTLRGRGAASDNAATCGARAIARGLSGTTELAGMFAAALCWTGSSLRPARLIVQQCPAQLVLTHFMIGSGSVAYFSYAAALICCRTTICTVSRTFNCTACHVQKQWGARPACKSSLMPGLRLPEQGCAGHAQLTAGPAAAEPSPTASALAYLICFAVTALYAATRKTRCPLGTSHKRFMQGGLYETAVRTPNFQGTCCLVFNAMVTQHRMYGLPGHQTAPCLPRSRALAIWPCWPSPSP